MTPADCEYKTIDTPAGPKPAFVYGPHAAFCMGSHWAIYYIPAESLVFGAFFPSADEACALMPHLPMVDDPTVSLRYWVETYFPLLVRHKTCLPCLIKGLMRHNIGPDGVLRMIDTLPADLRQQVYDRCDELFDKLRQAGIELP